MLLTRLFSFVIDVSNRRAGDLEDRLVGAADQKSVFPHHRDHTDDAAGRDYAIVNLQTSDSFLQLPLPLLLGPY